MIDLSPAAREHLLALADDEHMIGAQHATWIGVTPFLEEDLAFCSIAQDELGHALELYQLLTDDVDRFALLRDAADYRSCWFAERSTPEWSDALVRHWLYDHAERLRWQALAHSSVAEVAVLARLVDREESFHRQHADQLMRRLLTSGEARPIVIAALHRLLPIAVGIFDPVASERGAIDEGVVASSSADLAMSWRTTISQQLETLGVTIDWPVGTDEQRHRTVRDPGFAAFHDELREVISLDPGAVW